MKRILDAIEKQRFVLGLHATDIESICTSVVSRLEKEGLVSGEVGQRVVEALLDRERVTSTALGHAVAVPHAYVEGLDEPIVYFARLANPINMGATDGVATQFLFFLIGPLTAAGEHLDTLASVARLMADEEFRYEAGAARSQKDLLSALEHYGDRVFHPEEPRREETSPGLTYTGRLFGGLKGDIARRKPHYASDFRDGLHAKCVGATLFLFFACLAPAVTFGGLMAVLTGEQIGAIEMIVASAGCGVVYALLSGQPLVILGGTGPLLVFTAILYRMCGDFNVPFLPTYAWVGLWSMLLLLLMAITDAGCLMRYFTRFTDESFSALISLIFIYEAIKSLIHVFRDLDVNKHHDTALLTLLLALGTFYIAMSLSRFRHSAYLRPKMREFLADFGPAIALVVMTGVAIWLHEVDLMVLPAPEKFGTTSGRPWMIDLWAAPTWVRWAAVGPAVLVAILVFLDQNITARLVNSPDHKLQKGEAYHLDLALVGVLLGVCSLFGLPWLVAATVRSLNHVRSLATVEEEVIAHGETRDKIIHVRENRVTGFAIHLLVGLSVLLLAELRMIPMAVLYGIFLFMGVVSMSGNQFFERLSLWMKDPELYPAMHFIRRVPHRIVHQFTLIQFVCIVILWVVKGSRFGILFPLFIALLVPTRILMGRFFDAKHLAALDAEEEPDEESTHWAG